LNGDLGGPQPPRKTTKADQPLAPALSACQPGCRSYLRPLRARTPAFRNIDLATWVPAQIGSQECGSSRHRYSYIRQFLKRRVRGTQGPRSLAGGFAHNATPLTLCVYDLSKLRAKGLIAKLPYSRRYQLLPHGYSICLIFLKLFERVYAPLTAGLLSPIREDD
jgi:hypothetical protein